MKRSVRVWCLSSMLLLLTACAGMPTGFEEPSLTVTNIALKNSSGMTPRLELTLNITNPNRLPLDIEGMSYDVYLAGNKIVSGVANDFPEIRPYSEAEVTIDAMISVLGSINLIRDLASNSREAIDYRFNARLDVGRLLPSLTISKSGAIPLR